MTFTTLGLITPHAPIEVAEVGRERSDVTAATSAAMLTCADLLRRFDPDTIVLMSPHAPILRDAFLVDTASRYHGDLGGFGALQVRISTRGDAELGRAILEEAVERRIPAVDRGTAITLESGELDHGALVPLSFLDRPGCWPLVELSLSLLPYEVHIAFGRAVAAAAARLSRKVAFVASGDASHRLTPGAPAGFSPDAKRFDEEVLRLVRAGDFAGLTHIDPLLIEDAGECGLRSWITLGGFLEGRGAATRLLSYEGPWGVGYMTAVAADPSVVAELPAAVVDTTPAAGRKGGAPGDDESVPVALARRTINTYVRYGTVIDLEEQTDDLLASSAGAFVSLHTRNGDLRGCIGTITPYRENLAEEIAHNAIQAATCDPRFPPLTPEELDDLDVSVDVLHEPEHVSDVDALDPKTYGVIVTNGRRRGLLLPDLEGVETPEAQVSIAMQKAGIPPGEPIGLERFKVDRYH
ncbi:MAG TPA: AmmeMemoRadiSam system protein A [Coriobacteriia bacterium]|jgi:AmmeMemoRadiSam system protein A